MSTFLPEFRFVWLADFEFQAKLGEPPKPICMVAREIKTSRTLRLWEDELLAMRDAPLALGEDSLFVAYYAPAEFGCFHKLGWPLPKYCLDLFTEFRNETNVHSVPNNASLLNAMVHYEQDALSYDEKESMRDLAIRGGPFSNSEREALLAYCESDVVSLEKLIPLMLPKINLRQALLRGRYMKAISVMEKNGVPIDVESLDRLNSNWDSIQDTLVERIDKNFGVFEGRTFKRDRFDRYLCENGLLWPRHETGALMLDEDTFHDMVRAYPQIAPLKELRYTLSQLRLSGLAVGADGRNRTSLSAFRAKTGRNQPSNAEFIFGPSCWIRGLIRPPPGHAVAYIDWSQQEFGIAAKLSGDPKMIAAYQSGDPYLAFAKQAGAIPADGTKKTHASVRDLFKACVLAVQYGMGATSLAGRIERPRIEAQHLLRLHRETYPTFWRWSDAAVMRAMLTSQLQTVFGWSLGIKAMANERSLRNFPMQANGAEMLRLACCLLVEAGIEVCAPVHDAILIVAPSSEILEVVTKAKGLMEQASAEILDGFRLRSDVNTVIYPDRYMDPRGLVMWKAIWEIIDEIGKERLS